VSLSLNIYCIFKFEPDTIELFRVKMKTRTLRASFEKNWQRSMVR